ncbi:hypothetical protein ES689_14145 [Frigoribacterium sp. ACAM 257]|uniref:hypothetical protein n=1 Tax=Frigoribacterium sp. ACAM 257 TaxID=2508998 RepID=UPI0011B9AAE0|nr:hypothetical protein [Frigoribacterium sp. ACAM 257]TWX34980.1 hypothetical protein ES689_14145 [Frigoribacterium sp. ACAM 257]
MPLRITTATTKIGVVIVAVVLGSSLGLLAAFLLGSTAGALVLLAVTVATVVFCGRTFRADDEPIAPARPAWRLTGGTTSSIVMAGFFVCQGVSTALAVAAGDGRPSDTVVAAVVYAALAAAYVLSAAKQRGMRTTTRSTSTGSGTGTGSTSSSRSSG